MKRQNLEAAPFSTDQLTTFILGKSTSKRQITTFKKKKKKKG